METTIRFIIQNINTLNYAKDIAKAELQKVLGESSYVDEAHLLIELQPYFMRDDGLPKSWRAEVFYRHISKTKAYYE